MRFTKMHGAGNDFIIIDNTKENIPEEKLSALAARLCSRRLSIGADGLMAVCPAKNGGDYAMLFYNSDGSLGEMCGNGARCICRYGFENGLAGEVQRVETTAGLVTGRRISQRMYQVRLNDPSTIDTDRRAIADGNLYRCCYIELGSPGLPHAVLNMPGWERIDRNSLRSFGSKLRRSEVFPKGANVTFAELVEPNHIRAVTFERGVEDFTLACGTGCGATATAFFLQGLVTEKNIHITMPGGELYVDLRADGSSVSDIMLTGPTNIVCTGEILDEDLSLSKKSC